jgi:hypothetical protein
MSEIIILSLIGGATSLFLVRRFKQSLSGKTGCGCSGCKNCISALSCSPESHKIPKTLLILGLATLPGMADTPLPTPETKESHVLDNCDTKDGNGHTVTTETDQPYLLSDMAFVWDFTWESRYVSEGRDNLDKDSLAGTTVEASWRGTSLGFWYAASPQTDYHELNLIAAYGYVWEGFEAKVSYTHLRFFSDKAYDNEVGAGLAYTELPLHFSAGIEGYYSFEAEGAFVETVLGSEIELHERLTLTPSAILGFNQGYIPDGHDGPNHATLMIEARTPLFKGLELAAYAAYTWGISSDAARHPGDEMLKNFPYFGVTLNASF